jgi:hypothetical protein
MRATAITGGDLLRAREVIASYASKLSLPHVVGEDSQQQDVQTRAQRAHWQLSWEQRLARNARPSTALPLEVTIHSLPATFAQVFGFDVVIKRTFVWF